MPTDNKVDLDINHKGQWCIFDKTKFCQEGICFECEIYKKLNATT